MQNESGEWDGKFQESAETILRQHLAQSSLGPTDEAMAQWIEYSNIHVTHTLSFALFADILQKLMHPMTNGLLSEEEVRFLCYEHYLSLLFKVKTYRYTQ